MVENDGRERYLDHDEERRGLFSMPETIQDEYVIAIDTGLRAEEQWGLRKTDINRAKRRITIRASEAKSGKSRSIPLTDRAWEIIERRLLSNVPTEYVFWRWVRDESTGEDRPERIEHTWAYREFQKGITAAGLKDVEWHDLRRTCGCRLLQDKCSAFVAYSAFLSREFFRIFGGF